jgi:hypothetical protein
MEKELCPNCGRPKSTTYAQLKEGECGAHDAPHFLLGLAIIDCEYFGKERAKEAMLKLNGLYTNK